MQPVAASAINQYAASRSQSRAAFGSPNQHIQNAARMNSRQPRAAASYVAADSLSLTYRNADGDSVALHYQHMEYGDISVSGKANQDTEGMRELVRAVGDQLLRQQHRIIRELFGEGEKTEDANAEKVEESGELQGLPEYWNAENTSQRIVDFAVSFFDLFEGAPEEYLSKIKGAIEEGFSQAREMMGEMPEAVGKLTNDTYELVMQKLDAWAAEHDIGENQQSVAEEAVTA